MADRGALINLKWWFGGYAFPSRFSTGGFRTSVPALDAATFADTHGVFRPGIPDVRAEFGGIEGYGAGEPDTQIATTLRTKDIPFSASPMTGVVGDVAYFFRASVGEYRVGARVGELLRFDGSAFATDSPLIRGKVLHNAAQSSSGNGTALQLGAVATGKRLYAALHVLAIVGTLDVIVQSDNAEGFPSATGRITLAQAAAIGYDWGSADGEITDDWWRVNWTLSGGGSATFVVVAGIR